MKKYLKALGSTALAALLIFSFVGCDTPTSSTHKADPTVPVAGDFTVGNLQQTERAVTAVTIMPKEGKSQGAITIHYIVGGQALSTPPQDKGSYDVTFDVAAAGAWKAVNGLSAGKLVVSANANPGTPVAADFIVGNLSQTVGNVTAVTVETHSGKTQGAITIYYEGVEDVTEYEKSTTLPTEIGEYKIYINVVATGLWAAANNLTADSWVLVINPEGEILTPSAGDFSFENLIQSIDDEIVPVVITPKEGKSQGQITVRYDDETDLPDAIGNYAVTFDVAAYPGWHEVTGLVAGTLQITPAGDLTVIANVELDIIAPTKGATPSTDVIMVPGDIAKFSAAVDSWTPTVSDKFAGETEYTVTITLTAKVGYTFTGLESLYFNTADIDVDDVTNTGLTVTFSHTFTETNALAIKSWSIATQIDTVAFDVGDELDLTGLTLNVVFDDDSTDTIDAGDFVDYGITTVPADNTILTYAHNNTAIKLYCGTILLAGMPVALTTNALVVNRFNIAPAAISITAPAYEAAPATAATTSDANFTIGALTWYEGAGTATPFTGDTFGPDTVYTVQVTLTTTDATTYCFTNVGNKYINGAEVLFTIPAGGASVIYTYSFPKTLHSAVSAMVIKSEEGLKTSYKHLEALDLTGLVVTLSFEDGDADVDVAAADFATYGIEADPANGENLVRGTLAEVDVHNGAKIVLTHGNLEDSVETTATLTVDKADGANVVAHNEDLYYAINITHTQIHLNAINAAVGSQQSVEYGYTTNETDDPDTITSWQTSVVFEGLTAGTDYWFYGRTEANYNFNAGPANNGGAGIKWSTAATVDVTPTTFINFATIADEGLGIITVGTVPTQASGDTLDLEIADPSKYDSFGWYTAEGYQTTAKIEIDVTKYRVGKQVITLVVVFEGKPYSQEIEFTVTE